MQATVRLLTEIREAIIAMPIAPGLPAQHYYRGQIDLIDRLLTTIGEGALNDRVGTVQNGIELLSAEES